MSVFSPQGHSRFGNRCFHVLLLLIIVLCAAVSRIDSAWLRFALYLLETAIVVLLVIDRWGVGGAPARYAGVALWFGICAGNTFVRYGGFAQVFFKIALYACLILLVKYGWAWRHPVCGSIWAKLEFVAIVVVPVVLSRFGGNVLSAKGYSWFVNENSYTYYGAAVGVYYYSKNLRLFDFYAIFSLFLFTSSRLGGGLSVVLASLIWVVIARKKLALFAPAVLLAILLLAKDHPFVERGLDTYNVMSGLIEDGGVMDLTHADFGDAAQLASDPKNTSLLFRAVHWSEVISTWAFHSDIATILIGGGEGWVAATSKAGLVAHNDYLFVLTEGGVISFVPLMAFVVFVVRLLKYRLDFIPVCTVLIYMIAENNVYNFPGTLLFLLGVSIFCCGNQTGLLT